MDRESVKLAVRTTLLLLNRVARRTTTQADDFMASVLQSNEERIVNAVMKLNTGTQEVPTDDQIVAALVSVGIKL